MEFWLGLLGGFVGGTAGVATCPLHFITKLITSIVNVVINLETDLTHEPDKCRATDSRERSQNK